MLAEPPRDVVQGLPLRDEQAAPLLIVVPGRRLRARASPAWPLPGAPRAPAPGAPAAVCAWARGSLRRLGGGCGGGRLLLVERWPTIPRPRPRRGRSARTAGSPGPSRGRSGRGARRSRWRRRRRGCGPCRRRGPRPSRRGRSSAPGRPRRGGSGSPSPSSPPPAWPGTASCPRSAAARRARGRAPRGRWRCAAVLFDEPGRLAPGIDLRGRDGGRWRRRGLRRRRRCRMRSPEVGSQGDPAARDHAPGTRSHHHAARRFAVIRPGPSVVRSQPLRCDAASAGTGARAVPPPAVRLNGPPTGARRSVVVRPDRDFRTGGRYIGRRAHARSRLLLVVLVVAAWAAPPPRTTSPVPDVPAQGARHRGRHGRSERTSW